MSLATIVTNVQTAVEATGSPASLILPTAMPTTLVAAGTPVTSLTQLVESTMASLASAVTSAAAVKSSGAASGGKRILTPEQQAISAYRAKWNGRMPIIFLIICAVFFGIWFLAEQPRVFARLFSSPLGKIWQSRSQAPTRNRFDQPVTSAPTRLKRKRTVGGEMWNGWVLKSGEASPSEKAADSPGPMAGAGIQIIRTPADAMNSPSVRKPTPIDFADRGNLYPPSPAHRNSIHGSLVEGLKDEVVKPDDGALDLAPVLSHPIPIYQSHRRNDSRPNLGRIITNIDESARNPQSRNLTRQNSLASAVESFYSQETTCVGHGSVDGHEDKIAYLKRSHSQPIVLSHASPAWKNSGTPQSTLYSALASAALYGSGPSSALLSACTEAPLLSATASPRFGEGLKRMTIANEAALNQLQPPPHIPSLLDRIPGFQKLCLSVPFAKLFPRLTLLDIAVYLLYIGIVAFANFYKNTDWNWNPKTNFLGPDLLRSGAIAMAQIPLVIGLGGRNSPVRYLLGGGQSRAVVNLHKFSGRACFGCMLLHVGGYGYKWGKAGVFITNAQKPYIHWGLTAVGGLTFMVLTSLPIVRRRIYNVFMISHILGLAAFLLGFALHVPEAVPYVLAGAGLYALELICRVLKTRIAFAELRVIPGADSIIVSIPGIRTGWRAGQHVILRVPALPKRGGLQFLEGHVFTIASSPGTNGLVLIVKRTGAWTQALFALASGDPSDAEGAARRQSQFKVLCEGPYGGSGHTLFASYSAVMLVAGGSGITHTLGVAHDLICKAAAQDAVRATHLDIVWAVKTQETARPLISTFKTLIKDVKRAHLAVRVHIYITGAPSTSAVDLLSPSTQEKMNAPFAMPGTMPGGVSRTIGGEAAWSCGSASRINIVPGQRPPIDRLLSELTESSIDFNVKTGSIGQGCGVAVCGPQSLVDAVRRATLNVEASTRLQIGGIELTQERFD